MEKHYLVYQITNLINQKIYIGIHETYDLDDEYMGSSVYLKRSIEKHGVENFKKEILFEFNNPKEMIAKERELVNDEFVNRLDTYNLNLGGGSVYYINKNGKNGNPIAVAVLKELFKDEEFRKNRSNKISEGLRRINFKPNILIHTSETKRKIGEKSKIHQRGEGNSQFGTCWIHNDSENKKIKKELIDQFLSEGWIKGRKIKF